MVYKVFSRCVATERVQSSGLTPPNMHLSPHTQPLTLTQLVPYEAVRRNAIAENYCRRKRKITAANMCVCVCEILVPHHEHGHLTTALSVTAAAHNTTQNLLKPTHIPAVIK